MAGDLRVRIGEVDPASRDFESLKALSRQHQALLGHLPWEAFLNAASSGPLLGAWSEDRLIGYTLFRVRKRDRSVSLTHVCVATDCRGNGVARALVEAVAERNPSAAALTLKCRVDYEAAKLWPSLHFRQVGTTEGNGAGGTTTLGLWVRELDDTLFSFQTDDRMVVAIDSDVLRDIVEPRNEFESSRALLDDWVDEVAELLTVPNVETEINEAVRKGELRTGVAWRFRQLRPDPATADQMLSIINDTPISSAVRVGDRRNIAQAAAGGAEVFVTRDQALLGSSVALQDATGIDVLSPSDMLLRLHAGSHADDYRPSALVRTSLTTQSSPAVPSTQALTALVDHETGEAARSLRACLERCVASTDLGGRVVVAVDSDDRLVAVLATRMSDDSTALRVDAIRVGTDRDRYAIARQLVHLSRQQCVEQGADAVAMDGLVPEYVARALRDEGFKFEKAGWLASCDRRTLTAGDLAPETGAGRTVRDLAPLDVSRLERERWPLRLFGSGVPTYIVPIQPVWAHALIDHDPPQQLLLHRDRRLGLSREHVYYKSKAAFIQAPARMLWYVSSADPNAGIRAWSWLESVVTDRPTSLYRRFGDQGVFTEADIEAAASDNEEATALVFSRTELFDHHLTLRRCRELVPKMSTSGFLTTARAVDEHVFVTLYQAGTGLR